MNAPALPPHARRRRSAECSTCTLVPAALRRASPPLCPHASHASPAPHTPHAQASRARTHTSSQKGLQQKVSSSPTRTRRSTSIGRGSSTSSISHSSRSSSVDDELVWCDRTGHAWSRWNMSILGLAPPHRDAHPPLPLKRVPFRRAQRAEKITRVLLSYAKEIGAGRAPRGFLRFRKMHAFCGGGSVGNR